MKCYRCKSDLPPPEMVFSGGKPIGVCLRCNRDRVRIWKKKNPAKVVKITGGYERRNGLKRSVYKKVRTAIKKGIICRPVYCSKCGGVGKIQAHHADYSKPLEVTFVCPACHSKEHFRRESA